MPIGPFDTYAPPGPYTRTLFENPIQGALEALRIPIFIGEGNEFLTQNDLENVRGSSATVDQRIVQEDETGRAVVSISATGAVTLGDWDGERTQFQVRNFPIVSGNGTGTTTNDRSDVSVTINGDPIVVLQLDGANGLVTLASPPDVGDQVYCTYFFNRTDTLQTDDVSDQVNADTAIVRALAGIGDVDAQNPDVPPAVLDFHDDITNALGDVVIDANNVLILTVDGTEYTLTIPARNDYTMAQVATTITSLGAGSLVCSTFINNFGHSTLQLVADEDIVVGDGSANALLGIQAGQADLRTRTFYTFNGPIVDGSNGGVTTTDPADVVVKVDNVQVIPTSVNGTTRAVTLPYAPKAGSTVTIRYYYNTWQDTFDYLAHIGVTSVTRCGEIPGASTYTQEVDFILKDDKIVWGTSVLVSTGTTTTGATPFGENQITANLIDNQTFLDECSPVVTSSGGVATESTTEFQLPFTPTTGNGRDTRLGQSLFQQVTNGRIDLPTSRPDLVNAYWGYGVQDALDRGQVEVTRVEGIVITLKDPVPVGATVYASFYYNLLTDQEYTLTSVIPGISGVGTYTVTNQGGLTVYNPSFDIGSKGTALTGITIEFPSGSELKPDLRFESVSSDDFEGPLQEVVTVQFETRADSPARYTSPGSDLYEFVEGQSDRLRVGIDGQTIQFGSAAGGDFADPNGFGTGFFAEMVGEEIDYTGGAGATVGVSYDLTTNENINLLVDGVQVAATIPAATNVDILHFVDSINEAVAGTPGVAENGDEGSSGEDIVLQLGAHPGEALDGYYDGWRVVLGPASTMGTPGEARDIVSYDETTRTATLSSAYTLIGFAEVVVQFNGVLPGDQFILNGVQFDAIGVPAGPPPPGGPVQFDVSGGDAAAVSGPTGLLAQLALFLGLWPGGPPDDITGVPAAPNEAVLNPLITAGLAGEFAITTTVGGPRITLLQSDLVTPATNLRVTYGPRLQGGGIVGDSYYLYNPDAAAIFKGATRFNGPVTLTTGNYDTLDFIYQGDVTGATAVLTAALTSGALPGTTYATAADLAAEVQTQMNAVIPGGHLGLAIEVVADADGRMQFKLQLPANDTAGFLTFIATAGGVDDFAILAGIETGATVGDGQPHLLQGPIARASEDTVAGFKPYDRMVLRNRILPGQLDQLISIRSVSPDNALEQMSLEVQAGSGNEKAGLVTGAMAYGADKAVVHPATLVGRVGFGEGTTTNGEPQTTFYDGTAVAPANNEFSFTVDGVPVTVTFTATPTGTATPLGPCTGASSGSICDQVIDAIAAVAGGPFGATPAAVYQLGLILQDGDGLRITSQDSSVSSAVVIGSGSANDALGFTDGEVGQRTLVSASVLASALMSNRVSSFVNYVLTYPNYDTGAWTPAGGATANYFADLAYAKVEEDATGNDYLYVQSLSTGTGSIILFRNTSVGQDALFPGTGLNIPSGDGAVGEAGLNGFFVLSSDPNNGSGSANTSVLNPAGTGAGQDGVVGQTYRDDVTGLTFTILPRDFIQNPNGPWLAYPTGTNATFRIDVSNTFTTDANLPHNALNGVELIVSNTSGVTTGDTAIVETFERGGLEPAIGDLYYVSYIYRKQDYTTAFFTRLANIEASYGQTSPDAPVSLASYLAILNGAVLVGIKQVPRAEGSNYASLDSYAAAIQELEGPLPGNAIPDVITPLRGDSLELYQILKRSNSIMSSIRYRSERTSIIGLAAGSLPRTATDWAQSLDDTRMRMVYPDMVTLSLQDALGNITESLIDGPMIAAGLVGSVTSANVDVATPWTNRRLVGYTSLARPLDAVEMNQIAQKGVTVIDSAPPFLRVRHGLTTDVDNVLTRTPTIILIADEVQRQSRVALESFIGIKFLPGILSQVEGRLSMTLNALVKKQIIAAYTGLQANVNAEDPTVMDVEAFYQPIFPLLYIVLTFHLRSSLT